MVNYKNVKSTMSDAMKKMLKNQCQSIVMSDIKESDKKQSLEMLIYDDNSAQIVNEWLDFIIE